MAVGPQHGSAVIVTLVLILLRLLPRRGELVKRYNKRPDYCAHHVEGDGDENKSFLWAASKREPPCFFFGTIHVPYTRVWDSIPDEAKRAFEASDNVVFELDLMDPHTISALSTCQMLPRGESLADVLPDEIYRRLKRHLDYVRGVLPSWMSADQRGRGLYADYLFNAIAGNWERKRPVWVMLMVNSLTESDVKSRGIPVLDLYLAQEAQRMGKRTGAVEKVEEQCVPLNGLNVSQVLFALNQTLFQHESMRTGEMRSSFTTDDLIKHYNCGDLNAVIFSQDTTQVPSLLNATALTPRDAETAREIDDYFRRELMYKRNERMADRVVDLLRLHPEQSFFFAFGAGHFLGNHTVLDFVRDRGYRVDHLLPSVPGRNPLGGPKSGYRKNREQRRGSALQEHPWGHAMAAATSSFTAADEGEAVRNEVVPPLLPPGGGGGGGGRTSRPKKRLVVGTPLDAMMLRAGPSRTTRAPVALKQRKFNDLWVRIDDVTTRSPARQQHQQHLPQDNNPAADDPDARTARDSLHGWYGLDNEATTSRSDADIATLVCAISVAMLLL